MNRRTEIRAYGTLERFAYRLNPTLADLLLRAKNWYIMGVDLENGRPYGKPPRIKDVSIEVTIRCNLRCKMCWWWGENGVGPKLIEEKSPLITQEMSLETMKSVIDQVAKYGPGIYLSGGEPFIRGETIELLEYAEEKGLPTALTTNGTLITDELARRLCRLKNLSLIFSVDGLKDAHDEIRGKGNYDKTIGALKMLLECRKANKQNWPALSVNTTVSHQNLRNLVRFVKELDGLGVDRITIQNLWWTDKRTADEHFDFLRKAFGIVDFGVYSHVLDEPFSDEELATLESQFDAIYRTSFKTPVRINPRLHGESVFKYYKDPKFSKAKKCVISYMGIVVRANGDVMFCPDGWINEFKLGNVRQTPIEDMWNGEKAWQFRRLQDERKLFPACAKCCRINQE